MSKQGFFAPKSPRRLVVNRTAIEEILFAPLTERAIRPVEKMLNFLKTSGNAQTALVCLQECEEKLRGTLAKNHGQSSENEAQNSIFKNNR